VLSRDTPTWRRLAEASLWGLVGLGAVWLAVRLFGLESGFPLVPLIAFTPFVPIAGVLMLGAAVALRRRPVALAAAVLTAAFAALVLPRAFGDQEAEPGDGARLTVLTANLKYGDGSAEEVADLVSSRRVDLLSLQELTPQARDRLQAAGLSELLPHEALDPGENAAGSALYARHPLRAVELTAGEGGFAMPQAVLAVRGGPPIEVMAVHPPPPTDPSNVAQWERDLSALPRAEPEGPIHVLAGDFNATLDHAELRDLIASGYSDAADAVGSGLVHTWPRPIRTLPLTLDHVLVDERVYVEDVSTHELSGSDHRMVLAELILPPAGGR
jgi:endonuclease/exonuclease/phosphatase (EEP) superfamily protein YafD